MNKLNMGRMNARGYNTRLVLLTAVIIPVLFSGCVELYDFRINDDNPSLVIEGQISDLSYRECFEIPADGRYFTVKLSRTSNVANERNQPVKNANVMLFDSEGRTWNYVSSEVNPGLFMLFDQEFKARESIGYKLRVEIPDGGSYESAWEILPGQVPSPPGDIDFEEVVRQQYVYQNREKVLDDVSGIAVNINLPRVTTGDPAYYRWEFDATWIFRASLVSSSDPTYRCWITDPYYLSGYVMQQDNAGGYKKELFFMKTEGNDRFFDRMSFLIRQYALSEHCFNYWSEIQQQDERKGLFDPPPFNLLSNLHADDPAKKVYGYFSVVNEQATRWYFSRTDLSYPVENTWQEFCLNPNIRPEAKPQCYSCLNYGSGIPSTEEPWWWEE